MHAKHLSTEKVYFYGGGSAQPGEVSTFFIYDLLLTEVSVENGDARVVGVAVPLNGGPPTAQAFFSSKYIVGSRSQVVDALKVLHPQLSHSISGS